MRHDTGHSASGPPARRDVVWCVSDDTGALDHLAQRLRDNPRSGLGVVWPVSARTDPQRSEAALATEVARAVGIRVDVEGRLGLAHTMTGLVPHLICGQWQHLLVLSSNWSHWRAVAALVTACRAAGVTAWLVTTSDLDDAAYTFYTQVSAKCEQDEMSEFLESLPVLALPAREVGDWDDIKVPTSDFVTFLADVDEQLPVSQVQVVERELRAEHARALAWFDSNMDASQETVAQELRQAWDECGTISQFLTKVRGWQIAAFSFQRLLKVDVENLVGYGPTVPPAATRTWAVWHRLNSWWEPSRAASCALVAAGMGSEDVCEVILGQVSADGSAVATASGTYSVEETARVHVERARLRRLLDGAGGDEPLIVTARGQVPDWRWVTRAVDDARKIYDIALSSGGVSRRAVKPDRWAQRHGLSLMELS